MSKKIAGGASTIMLDVKCGDGAFSPDVESAAALADLCVRIGVAHGRRCAALVTDMSQPLGDAIGNALEVRAAVEVLQGRGSPRLREVSLALTAGVLELEGRTRAEAHDEAVHLLESGEALERFRRLVAAQGGDASVADDPDRVLPRAPQVLTWTPPEGLVTSIACRRLGELAGQLGAGRARSGATIDPDVGLEVLVRVGDPVGDAPAVRIHARDEPTGAAVLAALPSTIGVGPQSHESPRLVLRRVGFSSGRDDGER
jgi:thymidine phosphorylase